MTKREQLNEALFKLQGDLFESEKIAQRVFSQCSNLIPYDVKQEFGAHASSFPDLIEQVGKIMELVRTTGAS